MKKNKDTFRKGWGLLRAIDQHNVRDEVMTLFGIKSRNAFYERRKGLYKLSYDEKIGIENIFKKYGIPANSVWGE